MPRFPWTHGSELDVHDSILTRESRYKMVWYRNPVVIVRDDTGAEFAINTHHMRSANTNKQSDGWNVNIRFGASEPTTNLWFKKEDTAISVLRSLR